MNPFIPINSEKKYFVFSLLTIGLLYFIFELWFIPYSALSADEFVFARHIFEYTFHLPYRDFAPYKTVLGYYLLSLPMFFSHALLAPIFYIKIEIALINALCLISLGLLSASLFDRKAILISLLAVIANQLFIVYSSDLRVDMLTSWACLFAVIFVLKNRMRTAGFVLGIGFLISQKALWYIAATNVGMLICLHAFSSTKYTWRAVIRFNVFTAVPIIFYILFWGWIGGFHIVLSNLFYEAYIQAKIDLYNDIYLHCWSIVLSHGPILFLLWPISFFMLSIRNNSRQIDQVFILLCASTALLLFIQYKQPFPYNFVFTIPAYWLIYAELFTVLFSASTRQVLNNMDKPYSTYLILPFIIYVIFASVAIYFIWMPYISYFYLLLPLCILAYFFLPTRQLNPRFSLSVVLILFIFLAILKPMQLAYGISQGINGQYQQTMLQLTENLLAEEEDQSAYIAGIPFLYQKDQAILSMANLIEPALQYLLKPNEQIKLLLLPSLYLEASTPEQVLAEFKAKPIKIILNNYRMFYVPQIIQDYVAKNYQHFYGSIYIYAPLIEAQTNYFNLKFSGIYRLQGSGIITIDNVAYSKNTILQLQKGPHTVQSAQTFRLLLSPKVKVPEGDLEDKWYKMIKNIGI